MIYPLRFLIGFWLVLLLLVGCGSGESTPAPTLPAPTATTQPATSTPEPETAATAVVVVEPTETDEPEPATPTATQEVTPVPPTDTPEPAPTATATPVPPAPVSDTLTAYFLDVGQGDSTLLIGPGFTILIDAGRHNASDVVPYLEQLGVEAIDLLIGTHPHADHIGQIDRVLQRFPVTEVWLSGDTTTTLTFARVLDAIDASEAGYHEPRAGEVYQIGSARVEVVNPSHLTGELHEGSIAVRILFGAVVFLFTGDAEAQTEQAMISRGQDLRAHVLQLGHHGSRTSSTLPFLQAVQPEIAIWSAGEGNSYGHPHDEVINRLAELNVPTYGTAIHGTIVVTTDGQSYEVTAPGERAPPATPTETPAAAPPTVNANANLRAGPSTNFEVVGSVNAGTGVTPIGRNQAGDWVLVEVAAGQQAWIALFLVDDVAVATLPVTTEVSPPTSEPLVPSTATIPADTPSPPPVPESPPTATSEPPPPPSDCVNINTASPDELQRIIHIGPERAEQILNLRPFRSVDDMIRISGIGAARLADIKAQGLACVE